SEVAGGDAPPLPDPETLTRWPMEEIWQGGYIASIDVRPVVPVEPGRATAWVSTRATLVEGEEASPLASYVALVDTANGLAARVAPHAWLYPNVDLTIHLHRQPTGRWVGLDSTAVFGSTGQGITSSVLHDLNGPVGRAQQMLTVRPPLA
ncbi:MAG TPA: thioesterase family protein, partial [Pseudolysinimonas sp.]